MKALSIDEARMIRDAANRYGVPVIDTYYALKNKPLSEIYIYKRVVTPPLKRGETKSLPI